MSTEQQKMESIVARATSVKPSAKPNGEHPNATRESKQIERDRKKAAQRELALKDIGELKLNTMYAVAAAECTPKVPIFREILYPGAWLFVGRPKIGKSWALLQMALAASEERGTFLGYPATEAVEVLYIAAEDDDARIQSRLRALGVANAPTGCYIVTQKDFQELALRFAKSVTLIEFLEGWLQRHPKVRLVLLDTETTCRQIWNAERGEADDGQRVTDTDYKQVRPFDVLALRRRIAIVLVNHASKRKGDWFDIHELINRSNTALAGASGSIVLADPPDADPFDTTSKTRVLGIRGRDLLDDVLLAVHLGRDGMPYFVVDGPYQEVRQTDAEEEILEALERLMSELPEGKFVCSKTFADEIGHRSGTVKRTISRMLKKERLTWKNYRIVSRQGKDGGLRLERREAK